MLRINSALCFFFLLLLFSCQDKKADISAQKEYYFSLNRYFQEEAKRLSSQSKPILKEVSRNSSTETKTVEIDNWEKEFGLFIESDINKLSWKDSYREVVNLDTLTYVSIDPELRTQKVVVIKNHEKVTEIRIENKTKNVLYNSVEKLGYLPDSLYSIEKQQDVVFTGNNKYRITGIFNP